MLSFFYLLTLLLVSFWRTGSPYNIDVSPGAVTHFTINITGSLTKENYAGYKLSASVNATSLRLLAGTPKYSRNKEKPYLSNGSIVECSALLHSQTDEVDSASSGANVTNYNTAEWMSPPTCQTLLTANDLTLGSRQETISDHLGFTMIPTNDSQYAVCVPGRQKRCLNDNFTPGACYTGAISNTLSLIKWGEKSCFKSYVDLMYLVDSSGSISAADFTTMKGILLSVSEKFQGKLDATQVGILQYGQNSARNPNYASFNRKYYRTPLQLGECQDVTCLKTAIDTKMNHMYSANTFTALAIERAVKIDFASSKNKAISKKILVLITDGIATDKSNLMESYALTQENNITVYAIGVGSQVDNSSLKESANGGKSWDRVLNSANYNQLESVLGNLTQQISTTTNEGQKGSVPDIRHSLENALFGMSGYASKTSGQVVIGAVGAYRNVGTIVKYSGTDLRNPYLFTYDQIKHNLPGLTKDTYDSYLGFRITSGNYNGGTSSYIAASAPRYQMVGSVIFVNEYATASSQNYTLYPFDCNCTGTFSQLGSYFGGSLLTADLNNDGLDDLLVGSPLYIGQTYDEGRVFVYMSQGTNTLQSWTDRAYRPTEISGNKEVGGRFGTTMTLAGDMNDDSYNDVVIAAPMAENGMGAVYLYLGGSDGISAQSYQKISASNLEVSGLVNFGLSLESNIDLDGNLYPDLIVGAPTSDKVVIFRTRALVKFNNSLTFSSPSIDVITCLTHSNRTCLFVQTCFQYTGKSVERNIDITYNVSIDQDLRRVHFLLGSAFSSKAENQQMTLAKDVKKCHDFRVFIAHGIMDFNTPVMAKMTYKLAKSHITKPLASMEEKVSNATRSSISFAKSCGIDQKCHYDLQLTGKLTLPSANLSGIESTTNNRSTLVISTREPIVVKVNFTNKGEISYGTTVFVNYSEQLVWKKILNVTSSNAAHQNCVLDLQPYTSKGGSKTKVLTYEYDKDLKSVMQNGDWCYFEFQLSTSILKQTATLGNVNISLLATSRVDGIKGDKNATDNSWLSTHPVVYVSSVKWNKLIIDPGVVFNYTISNKTINSVQEIGLGASNLIVLEGKLEGTGFSVIPSSTFSLLFPSQLKDFPKQRLLYATRVQCGSSQSPVDCHCSQENINPLKLHSSAVGQSYINVTAIANPNPLANTNFDCGMNASNSVVCDKITCQVGRVAFGDKVQFNAEFRLWTQTFNLPANITTVTMTSQLSYNTMSSPFIVDKNGRRPLLNTLNIVATATLFVQPVASLKQQTWWIIVASVAGGVLLLIAMIVIMYKLGFFKSTYADKKGEAMQWESHDTDIRRQESQMTTTTNVSNTLDVASVVGTQNPAFEASPFKT